VSTYAILAFRPKERAQLGKKSKKGGQSPQDSGRVLNIVAVATMDKALHFFETDGTHITTYHATHVVTKIAFESSDAPLIATAGSDGTLLFHNVTLWKNDAVLVGKRPRAMVVPGEFNEDGSPKKIKQESPANPNVHGYALVIMIESVGDTPPAITGKLPEITDVFMHTPRGGGSGLSRKVLIADALGTVRLYFSRNGTLTKSFDAGSEVTAMAKAGPSVALGVGPDVHFVSATKLDKVVSVCPGIIDTVITSLQYDVLTPSYLYAGLNTGDVLVFNTKHRQSDDSGNTGRSMCKLIHKAPKSRDAGAPGTADHLFGIKGYVMAGFSSSNSVAVWNTTDVRENGARSVIGHEVTTAKATKMWDVVSSEGAGNKIENLLFGLMVADDKIVVYEHLLPHHYHYSDISWLRVPLVLVGIGLVFFYNYWNKGGKKSRRGGNPFAEMEGMGGFGGLGGRGGGGGDDFGGGGLGGLSASDMASLKKLDGIEGFDMSEFSKFVGGGSGGKRGGGGGFGGGGGGGGFGGGGGMGGGLGLGVNRRSPGPKFGKGARFG
jgi:hypothetical protein